MRKFTESVVIENVYPEINNGKFHIKRIINDEVEVWADIFKEGHEPLEAYLQYKFTNDNDWQTVPMELYDNDRWHGKFKVEKIGYYLYTIIAYPSADKSLITKYDKILKVKVDIEKARYAAWYEMWPRSQGTIPNKSATFQDCINRLPYIVDLGFDVVYLTPIHPIGRTHRKGPNNSLVCGPDDPGCPYAIGNELGGHRSIEPSLGTMKDFERFVEKANELGLEVALDIAHTCSPDHPYVKNHPDWFYRRPDGTIKCAENPPKRYEDIYPFNFYCDDQMGLWEELRDIFFFWISKGVKIFRIDNPHTKPFKFWEWVISEVHSKYPEVIFLSEAFTRPKVMKYLSKCGFTQSYTYFTWRNFKQEIIDYFYELTNTDVAEYMIGNLFTNTPDILPFILQQGGRPAFKMRFVLAATLSSVYGMYNGYELCENKAIPGKEEYLDSEKYQYKVWDWDRPGNIKDFIRKINQIRKENIALHYYKNLKFYSADDDNIIFYGKISPDKTNALFIAVNLDPFQKHGANLTLSLNELGISPNENYIVEELITGQKLLWKGATNYIELDPQIEPAAIFKIQPFISNEKKFDYYY